MQIKKQKTGEAWEQGNHLHMHLHTHTHRRGGYRGGPTHHTAMPLNPNVHSQSLLSLPMAPGNVRTTPIQQIGMVSVCTHTHTHTHTHKCIPYVAITPSLCPTIYSLPHSPNPSQHKPVGDKYSSRPPPRLPTASRSSSPNMSQAQGKSA